MKVNVQRQLNQRVEASDSTFDKFVSNIPDFIDDVFEEGDGSSSEKVCLQRNNADTINVKTNKQYKHKQKEKYTSSVSEFNLDGIEFIDEEGDEALDVTQRYKCFNSLNKFF